MTVRVFTAQLGTWDEPVSLIITPAEGTGIRARAFYIPEAIETKKRNGLQDAKNMEGHAASIGDEWSAKWLARKVWGEYLMASMAEMRRSFRSYRDVWDKLLALPEVTLLCDCPDAAHCHRTLLAASILPSFGASYEGERQKT